MSSGPERSAEPPEPFAAPVVLFRRAGTALDRREARIWAGKIRSQVAGGKYFCSLLTDDRELQRLNREFLGKDYPTDVLSFPSADSKGGLGDIAVSIERAAAQARLLGHSLETEVAVLMLHGVLHLLGYDHEKDGGDMLRAEKMRRLDLGLPTGLIERSRRK